MKGNQKMINLNKVRILFALLIFLFFAEKSNAQEYKVTGGNSTSGNNSDIIDYDIPNELSAGQEYPVSITIINTGVNKWTKEGNYFLKPYDEFDSRINSNVWGVSRVDIPYDINPNDKVTLTFKVIAPKTSDKYGMKWAMTKDNEFFGEYTNNVVNVSNTNISTVSDLTGNTEFLNVNVPATMTTGEKYKVRLTLKNTGEVEWLPVSSEYKIYPVTETSSDVTYPGWNTTPIELTNAISPGKTGDVEFEVTAPLDPGKYNLQWMMKKGDSFFGTKSKMVTVNVSRNSPSESDTKDHSSSFIEQKVPSTMKFNEMQDVSITMSNTGSKTWVKGSEQLAMIDAKMSPVSINAWNTGYMQLPHNVEPGGLVTFDFKVKPTADGWQYFQCSMMKEDGTLFGAPSQSVEVLVSK
jgi:hypothetical protein